MARAEKWTHEWVQGLPHPTKEELYPDPVVRRHRLVVSQTKKTFEIQAERPGRFGPRKTYKTQTGDALTTTVDVSDNRTIVVATLPVMPSALTVTRQGVSTKREWCTTSRAIAA
jgi:hypothetical protein